MEDYPILDLSDVRGYERLYQTLVRDDMIKPGKFTLLYNWYQANAISCDKENYMSRKTFCDRLANTDKKPYATLVQVCKVLDLLQWNIDVSVGQSDWCAFSYEQLQGIWNQYGYMFRDAYGLPPHSKYTAYKLCEDTLYPKNEPLSDLEPRLAVKMNSNQPRMVYICAPLRGEDMAANIERARMYARDVLLQVIFPSVRTSIFRSSPMHAIPWRTAWRWTPVCGSSITASRSTCTLTRLRPACRRRLNTPRCMVFLVWIAPTLHFTVCSDRHIKATRADSVSC